MHLEILVEEPSAEVALQVLVPKIAPEATFQIHPHQGKPALLGRLVHKLRGYAAYMKPDWRIVVLVDRDREDCVDLKKKLAAAAVKAGIPGHVLNRIAIEELEAWFLGDVPALTKAYPNTPPTLGARKGYRDPDAISGTWEALERALQKGGYFPGGLGKQQAAGAIAAHMDVETNRSHSFRVFRDGIRNLGNPIP